MNDLPDPSSAPQHHPSTGAGDTTKPTGLPAVHQATGSLHKEIESSPLRLSSESQVLTEIGKDIDLPKELTAAGITLLPTVVTLPKQVRAMGVTPTGSNTSGVNSAKVTLPLSDDQIAEGLKQGVASGWRWLAEWCVRKLKQFHIGLQSIHGHAARVPAS